MNRSMLIRVLTLGAVLGLSASASAQQPPNATIVVPSVSYTTACKWSNSNAAVNNQVTLTLTPASGQYVYIVSLDAQAVQNGTSTVNTLSTFTSTNLGGWQWLYSMAATANIFSAYGPVVFSPVPLKAAGTGAVTIVSPSAAANTAFNINACWYSAP